MRVTGMRVRAAVRVRLEICLTTLAAVLAGAAAVWPNWIEALTSADPDNHSGSAEWGLVLCLVVVVLALATLTGWDWRRAARRGDLRRWAAWGVRSEHNGSKSAP
jgi:hypothetical protein